MSKTQKAGILIAGAAAALFFLRSKRANAAPLLTPVRSPIRTDDFEINPFEIPYTNEPPFFPDFGFPESPLSGLDVFFLNPIAAGSRDISSDGIRLIKRFERFSATVYDPNPSDGKSEPTIGYGHLVRAGEFFTRVTQAEAESLLLSDIRSVASGSINSLVGSYNQSQIDALYSLVFNIGASKFDRSQLRVQLERGNTANALEEWREFRLSSGQILEGLQTRRDIEIQLYAGSFDTAAAVEIATEIFA